jgi:hypothetical protein
VGQVAVQEAAVHALAQNRFGSQTVGRIFVVGEDCFTWTGNKEGVWSVLFGGAQATACWGMPHQSANGNVDQHSFFVLTSSKTASKPTCLK